MVAKRLIRKTNDKIKSNKVMDTPSSITDREKSVILESIPDPVVLLDTDLKVVWSNAAMNKLFNLDAEQLAGLHCFEKMHGLKKPCRICPVLEAINTGQPCTVDDVSSLGKRWMLRAYPLRDGDGNTTRILEVITDVTEKKRSDEALRKNEEKFRSLVEGLNEALYRMSLPDGVYEYFSPSVINVVGYSAEKFLANPLLIRRIIHPDFQVFFNEKFEELKKGIVRPTFEYKIIDSDGKERWILQSNKGIFNDNGKLIAVEGLCRDISIRKRTEEALEKRIVALTRPLDDIESISFEDLFNLPDLQRLQDVLANSWGVAVLLTRPDGTFITQPSNFTYFCSNFIRKTEKGLRNCQISDAAFGKHNPSGPIIHKCLSAGLWGAGASITLGGRHIANWLIGQVRNEAQSEEEIMEYAREIGVDKDLFREAFFQVPVMPKEKFETIAHTLFALANQLSQIAYQNIQQARFIAERKKAEDALRKSEEKFGVVYEESPIGIELYDREGILLEVNKACLDIFAISNAKAVIGLNLFENPNLKEESKAQLRRGESVLLEMPFDFGKVTALNLYKTTKKGIIYLLVLITPLRDVTKQSNIGYLVHTRDICEQKRMEFALRDSEAKYRRLHESMTEAFASIDMNGCILESNRAFQTMLGYSKEELCRLTYTDITPGKWHALEKSILEEQLLARGFSKVYEKEYQKKDGTVFPVELNTFLIRDDAGTPVGMWSIVHDITERKRIEEERLKIEVRMREVQKLESLGVLAGGIAHDFNNLLMSILGRADLALFSLPQTSPAYHHIEEITRASHRAADLCRQMLAYSGKGRFIIGRFNISEIVREMGQMLNISISKNAMMRYSLAERLPPIEADATQMRQVVMNLITNASDSLGDRQGVITVKTDVMECDETYLSKSYLDDKLPAGTYVCLEVSDTGCGIDSETIGRIFDPFFTNKFTGRGLGLAAVLGIVRGHKGAIKVISEVGKGTTFKILLPAMEWNTDERIKTEERTPTLKGVGTILVVDDDSYVRDVASAMLTELGFQVLTATNGRDALNIFKIHRDMIICVILDLTMPEMGGEQTFTELRKLRNDIQVILSSGYNEQDVTQRFVGRGLAGFIQKPYTLANLRSALNRALI